MRKSLMSIVILSEANADGILRRQTSIWILKKNGFSGTVKTSECQHRFSI